MLASRGSGREADSLTVGAVDVILAIFKLIGGL